MAFGNPWTMKVAIPRNRAKQGIAWLWLNEVAYANWRIDDLHQKLDPIWRGGEHDRSRMRSIPRNAYREGFRAVLQDRTISGNRQRVRFHLDRPAPRSALLVLGDHLRDVGIPWLHFTTDAGYAITFRGDRLNSDMAAV